jgi:hypothetical protein
MTKYENKVVGITALVLGSLAGIMVYQTKVSPMLWIKALPPPPLKAEVVEKQSDAVAKKMRAPANEAKKSVPGAVKSARLTPPSISQSQRELLKKYSVLKQKVFLSESEKSARAAYLNDTALLLGLLPVLRMPASTIDQHQAQDAALDLLLEARADAQSDAAGAVLRSVVEDDSIEKTALSMNERTSVAGLKAEVLFKWSAQEPTLLSDMPKWLPGPISRKIWSNVLAAQDQNTAESMALHPELSFAN